jgi:hypothetical protein
MQHMTSNCERIKDMSSPESREKYFNVLLLNHSLPVSVELGIALVELRSWPVVDATLRERSGTML